MNVVFNSRNILYFFLFIFVLLEIVALQRQSHYVYDIPMCMFLLYVSYRIRHALYLYELHYFLFAVFLLIHCIGLYDLYMLYPLSIEYDYWVHGYFGFVSSLIILRWMRSYLANLTYQVMLLFVILFVLGISALHELYEYFGALILGKGEGVLFIGAGDLDQWDTQKDMLNNMLGAILGIIISYIRKMNMNQNFHN